MGDMGWGLLIVDSLTCEKLWKGACAYHEDGELYGVTKGLRIAGLWRSQAGHKALLRLAVCRLGAVHLQLPAARTKKHPCQPKLTEKD